MADSKKRRQHQQKSKGRNLINIFCHKNLSLSLFYAVHFPASCKSEAKWMFGHLDLNFDGYLSLQELYELEHDQVGL